MACRVGAWLRGSGLVWALIWGVSFAGLGLGGCGGEDLAPTVSESSPASVGFPTPADEDAKPVSDRRRRGLWVLCEGSQRVLDDPARIAPLLSRAAALGVSDLFVQVYRGGLAWYDASVADSTPYRANLAESGRDVLRDLITRAHAAGFRVHAWVNVLSLSLNRDAELVLDLGSSVVQMDRRGRSMLDYPDFDIPEPDRLLYRIGTRGVYLDPGAPGLTDRLVATFSELLSRYPELDGLHLDYIRHPMVLPMAPGSRFGVGLDFGYGAASRTRFSEETGLSGPYSGEAPGSGRSGTAAGEQHALPAIVNANAWDAWRRDTVTDLVRRIGDRLEVVHPEPKVLLSAAVIAYADRAYLSMAQDWRRWLEDGYIDFAVPMVYTKDDRLFRYQVESFGASALAARVWAGHGTWLFSGKPEKALAQLAVVASTEMGGDALFSYDAIADSASLFDALSAATAASDLPHRSSALPAAGPDPRSESAHE